MRTHYPKVVIVILNWNGLRDTLDCLHSLQEIEYPNYAVVVIDNGSNGNDAEVIQKEFGAFASVIRKEKNSGFTGGCNEGIRWALHSGAEYVLLLNNDTVVDPNFLMDLVRVAQEDKQIGIVGPKIFYYEQPRTIWCAGGRINFWTGVTRLIGQHRIDVGQFDRVEAVDFVTGAALMIKAETIRRIGLLNERYFAYYEEAEWCTQARKAGLRVVYVPTARVWHKIYGRKSSRMEMYYMTRNRFMFMKGNSSGTQFIVFSVFFLASDFILQMKNKLFMKPLLLIEYLKGIRDGFQLLAHSTSKQEIAC